MTHPAYTAFERRIPAVVGVDLVTSGTLQLVVVCPNCRQHHRHLGPGLRRSPCGTWYLIEPAEPPAAIRAA